jgi:hypothetical protein
MSADGEGRGGGHSAKVMLLGSFGTHQMLACSNIKNAGKPAQLVSHRGLLFVGKGEPYRLSSSHLAERFPLSQHFALTVNQQ